MKTFSKIILSAGIFLMFAGVTAAQKTDNSTPVTTPQKDQSVNQTYARFVDNNTNGICDNWEARHTSAKGGTTTVNCPKNQGSAKCQGNPDCCKQICKEKKNCCQRNCQDNANCSKNAKGNGSGWQYRHGCCNNNSNTSNQPSSNEPEKK